MTSFYHLFSSYHPCSGIEKLRIDNGSFPPITGKGNIEISEKKKITLKSVVHVPKFSYNLFFSKQIV